MIIDVKEYTLKNGLNVILSKRNDIPIAVINILFKVGSKDEDFGKKGMAHLFEHLMFEGSPNIIDNKFDEILSSRGGDSNAYTSYDSTGYYIIIPSNEIETAFWLDSDRLTGFEISDEGIITQKKVVIEEKKQVYDNSPYGTVEIESCKRLFPNSSYGSPIIGNENDINSITKKDLELFFKKYYTPNNAVISVVGDIEYDETLKLINKYYGTLKPNGIIIRNKYEEEQIRKEIVFNKEDDVQLTGRFVFYKIPAYGTKDYYTSVIVNGLLSVGESSLLQRILVYELGLLNEVQSYVQGMEKVSIFSIDAFLQLGKNFDEAIDIIDKVINDIGDGNFSDDDLIKVKNRLLTSTHSRLQLNLYVAERLSYLKTFLGSCENINFEFKKYESISKKDVIEFVNKYLKNNKRVVLNYFPKK